MSHRPISASGEFSLIEALKKNLGNPSPRVDIGIGDDAAAVVMPKESRLLLCTDALVEGVHFDLAFATPEDLGHKALASALSDLAAMNAHPLHALISLAIDDRANGSFIKTFLEDFYRSAGTLARQFDLDIVGGDLAKSKHGIFIDVACVGASDAPVTRGGARPGDWLAVSGTPGASAAGLYALQNLPRAEVNAELARAHLRPMPRFDLLVALNSRPGLCTSLIDISDGVSSEAHHLAEASRVGFEIEAKRLPLHPQARLLAERQQQNAVKWCLSGGEDYELLATLDPKRVDELGGPPAGFTIIGRAQAFESGVILIDEHDLRRPLEPTGHNHFASS